MKVVLEYHVYDASQGVSVLRRKEVELDDLPARGSIVSVGDNGEEGDFFVTAVHYARVSLSEENPARVRTICWQW